MNETIISLNLEQFKEYAEKRLAYFADKMPEGKLWNNHNGGYADQCAAIAMLMGGDIVAIYKPMCCLNPIRVLDTPKVHDGVTYEVALSTSSVAGNVIWKGDWPSTISAYNSDRYFPSSAIVAYRVF